MADTFVPAELFGQHVRLRLATKSPTSRYEYGDRHGYLTDLDSPTFVGLSGDGDQSSGGTYAYRLAEYQIAAYPRYRIHIFRWAAEDCWSWCREVGGDVYDDARFLPRFASAEEAWIAAHEWLTTAAAGA